MTDLTPGYILKSRYLIQQQLGQGGMGEVYLAEDQNLANQVAVKANHNLNTHASAQFIREARLLASLKHPNLPRVIDYFTEGESQFLVMDYIPGNDLRALLDQKTSIPVPQVLYWAEQLGNALNYLHNQNPPIYHRDVKPANIKLTPTGEVVLVDFGIAKTGDANQETQTGAWGYTPGFAPPEQVSGLRTGPFSDQFSLAATLYYLLAGKPPVDSAQRMMGSEEFIPLGSLMPKIPSHVSAAIDKALSLKPEARFTTIADFVGALANTTPIPDPSSAQRTVMASRGGVPPPPPITPPVTDDFKIDKPKKKSLTGLFIGGAVILALAAAAFIFLNDSLFPGLFTSKPSVPMIETKILVTTKAPTLEPTANLPTPTLEPTATLEPLPTTTLEPSFTAYPFADWIVFVSNRQGDGYYQLWWLQVMLDQDGNITADEPEQLTFTPGNKSQPSFSPDGKKIIFSGWNNATSSNGTPLSDDIWMLDLTQPGSEPVDLSLRPRDDKFASWSPDGKYIAFTSYYRDDNIPQLILMDATNGEQTLLGTGRYAESYSTWTRDSNFLYYVLTLSELNVLYMRDKFNLYQTMGKFDRKTDEGRLGMVSEPEINLDGSKLVYTQLNGTKRNIFSAGLADRGNIVTPLTNSGADYSPCWSPDSQWIVFTSERDGDAELYAMKSSGEMLINLTNFPSDDKEPAWQPVSPP